MKCQLKQPNRVIRVIMNSLTGHFAYTCDGYYMKPWTMGAHELAPRWLFQIYPKLIV